MPKFTEDSSIGVFDSGLGGLTVVKAISEYLPNEHIVYFGDTARVPYGSKSRQAIIEFSKENTEVLLNHKVKLIVVACNSSSGYAINILRREYDVPIAGVIRPGANRAVEVTRTKKIGVIATSATINSGAYPRLIQRSDPKIKVISQACPLFVPIVEEGWLEHKASRLIAEEYLLKMKNAGIDTLILGCTHYPLLKPILRQVMGPKVELVDSAQTMAMDVKQHLRKTNMLRTSSGKSRRIFLVSDKPQDFEKIARNFLGYDIKAQVV